MSISFVLNPSLPNFQTSAGLPLWVNIANLPEGAVDFLQPGTVFRVTGVTGQTAFNQTWTVDIVDSPTSIRTTSAQGTVYPTQGFGGVITVAILCFLEGTMISVKDGAIPIESLQKGMLVKTLSNGYLPVHSVSSKKIVHSLKNDPLDQLYKVGELTLTGGHSFLVDHLTVSQYKEMMKITGGVVYMTDDKFRLFTSLLENKENIAEGRYTIWHFALEDEDETINHGVYANGYLVESCSIEAMKTLKHFI
jgi:hypothetical protein